MHKISNQVPLSQEAYFNAISDLCQIDSELSNVVKNIGNPPFWSRDPGFPTLILIILEQQVSLASARAAFSKLEQAASGLITPQRFLEFTNSQLKDFGFSRQKTKYCQGLSLAILNGDLHLAELHTLDDISARNKLMKLNGIGPWTADIYLLMALLRPDIWPSGDLALAKAVQKIHRLPQKPNPEKLSEIAERWKPWRAVAARILWHDYLN